MRAWLVLLALAGCKRDPATGDPVMIAEVTAFETRACACTTVACIAAVERDYEKREASFDDVASHTTDLATALEIVPRINHYHQCVATAKYGGPAAAQVPIAECAALQSTVKQLAWCKGFPAAQRAQLANLFETSGALSAELCTSLAQSIASIVEQCERNAAEAEPAP